MAFGLSEREHGADVYTTDMVLTPASEEDRANGILYRATGEKYYIGNGNVASMVSVFGRRGDVERRSDAYVFFAADSRHENYHLIDNVVHMQIYVSTFRLENYPVRAEDILHTGVEAFAAALNTVNIGKFNLCSCSIGMVEHAFYEAITHAQNRILYGNPVTDFAHVRANFVDSYARTGGDEAVQPARGRLPPQREPRRPALPAVQPRDQGQGHDGGRDHHADAA